MNNNITSTVCLHELNSLTRIFFQIQLHNKFMIQYWLYQEQKQLE